MFSWIFSYGQLEMCKVAAPENEYSRYFHYILLIDTVSFPKIIFASRFASDFSDWHYSADVFNVFKKNVIPNRVHKKNSINSYSKRLHY